MKFGAVGKRVHLDLLQAAGFTFLALVATGALLVLAVKLQYPRLGADGSSLEALSAAVVAGLGSLRVPVHLGGLTASALPLGALGLIGWSSIWAVANRLGSSPDPTASGSVRSGMWLGLYLGPLAAFAALIFRIGGESPVRASPWWSLLYGALWGSLFGALGGAASAGMFEDLGRRVMRVASAKDPSRASAVSFMGLVLALLAVAAVAVVLVGVVGALLTGHPGTGFGLGEAAAGIIYFVLFAPNILVAAIALGMGSIISIGAQITQRGTTMGETESLSILSWGPGGAPWWAFALVLIPLVATVLTGYLLRSTLPRRADFIRAARRASGVVGLLLFAWAALAEARLGAGILGTKGVARLAPDPFLTGLLGAAWTFAGGIMGWWVAERTASDERGEG